MGANFGAKEIRVRKKQEAPKNPGDFFIWVEEKKLRPHKHFTTTVRLTPTHSIDMIHCSREREREEREEKSVRESER